MALMIFLWVREVFMENVNYGEKKGLERIENETRNFKRFFMEQNWKWNILKFIKKRKLVETEICKGHETNWKWNKKLKS